MSVDDASHSSFVATSQKRCFLGELLTYVTEKYMLISE